MPYPPCLKPWLLALLCTGLLSACQVAPRNVPASAAPANTVQASAPPASGTPASAYAQARKKWQTAELRDYQFTLRQYCFCPAEEPIRIVVKNRQVERAFYVPSGGALSPQRLQSVPTIDGLFATIDAAYARPADRIEITLDPQRGYPQKVFIDYSVRMADEELHYQISDWAE